MGGLIVVTRPEPDASDYAQELEDAGYQVFVEPMLRIDPVVFEKPNLSDYDGVLITSANAIEAYVSGYGEVSDIPVYCVGKHSAQAARDAGFVRVVSVDGTGADLLAHILNIEAVETKRFLHLCGRHVAFPIAGKLSEACIAADMVVVYEAVEASAFSDDFIALMRAGEVAAVTFFSKRTAECFVHLVGENFTVSESESMFSSIKALSISGAVLECVRVLSWHGSYAADTPDRAGMITLLGTYI